MTRRTSSLSLVVLAAASVAATSPARAQVQLDISKVTCNQFAMYKITDPRNIAIWLSGYYQGKRNDPIIDTQSLIAKADKLRDFCIQNPSEPVLQASEKFLGQSR